MDHFEARRHRLQPQETPFVMNLIYRYLEKLSFERTSKADAEMCFRILYRFITNSVGRPSYPEFDWNNFGDYLENGPFME